MIASRQLHIPYVLYTSETPADQRSIWAPASEVFGRRWIYIGTYAMLTMWQAVTCASQNGGSILVFRALAGFFGSSPLANAGGTIADVLDGRQMGIGMAFFSVAPFLGPALGPITGGFLGDAAGWRWVEGMLAIFCAVVTVMLFLWGAETYAPTILRSRADRLSKYTGKVYRFRSDAAKPLNVKELFIGSLIRPWKFLVFEPIVLLLSIYVAIIYGILYLNFAAYPIVFMQYRGWNAGEEGLAFLGIMVGAILSVFVVLFWGNKKYIRDVQKRGFPIPEDRLPPAFAASILIVIGLAGFAATDGPNVHWIASIIFGVPFGMGMVQLFLSILGYLVDCYTVYAASVLAANAVLRSLFGAGFPLFTKAMYDNIGIHWGAAVPGFLALACLPLPFIFYKYGPAIRKKCKYAAEAQEIMAQIIAARKAVAEEGAGRPDVEKNERSPVDVGMSNIERTISEEHGEDILDDYPEVMSLERSRSMQNEITDPRTRSNSLYRVRSGASNTSYTGGQRVHRAISPTVTKVIRE